jgi:DNA-binding SARP family transcriptional activator
MQVSLSESSSVSWTMSRATRPRSPGASDRTSGVVSFRWRLGADTLRRTVRATPAASLGQTTIELCGRLKVEIQGESLETRLPGRQGRMLFAYLAANRERPVPRDELMGALWPSTPPAAPGPALSTLLTRLRQAVGKGILEGRHELWLRLPAGASIDLEVMQARAARAERALASNDLRDALKAGREALVFTERRLLPEFTEPWVEERRREIDERKLAMLEVCARAGLVLGGHELTAAERAARTLVTHNPYRESSYALLMEIHAAQGDVAQALRVYDALRVLLRDELGVLPSPALIKLADGLLGVDEAPLDANARRGKG